MTILPDFRISIVVAPKEASTLESGSSGLTKLWKLGTLPNRITNRFLLQIIDAYTSVGRLSLKRAPNFLHNFLLVLKFFARRFPSSLFFFNFVGESVETDGLLLTQWIWEIKRYMGSPKQPHTGVLKLGPDLWDIEKN